MQRAGSALGLGWLPLPGPIGGGAVLAAALRDGSLALLDACQAADRRPSYRGRQSQIRALLAERRQLEGDEISNWDEFAAAATPAPPTPPHAGASDGAWDAAAARGGIGGGSAGAGGAPQRALVGLAPPRPLGSALLMRRPWALLLRLVLQLGLSQVRARGWGLGWQAGAGWSVGGRVGEWGAGGRSAPAAPSTTRICR